MQPPNHPRTQEEADQKGGQAGIDGPEGDVPEDIEGRYGSM
jgi:hypothetical protein